MINQHYYSYCLSWYSIWPLMPLYIYYFVLNSMMLTMMMSYLALFVLWILMMMISFYMSISILIAILRILLFLMQPEMIKTNNVILFFHVYNIHMPLFGHRERFLLKFFFVLKNISHNDKVKEWKNNKRLRGKEVNVDDYTKVNVFFLFYRIFLQWRRGLGFLVMFFVRLVWLFKNIFSLTWAGLGTLFFTVCFLV